MRAFEEAFGFKPQVIGTMIMDASLIRLCKEEVPELKICVAGCFEEGAKVSHGCNNSWFLHSEGIPWGPWYPSKGHSGRPASSEEDWAGVVAVPHLCRDLVLGYESRNDFFASHPANVQRGLANDGTVHMYDYNLCDQYRYQEDFNMGFSYYQIHCNSGWFHRNPNLIDPDDVTKGNYRETLEYVKTLCDEGKAQAMTFTEFADVYRKEVPIARQNVAVAKDILMGSGKHYFWACDAGYRVLVDAFQGGSIGDLRPYAGRYDAFTGVDAKPGRYLYNTYPYLIQSQYRTGYRTHYTDGTRTTLLVEHNGEKKDLCLFNTKIEGVERTETHTRLTLKPVDVTFKDGYTVTLQTVYGFEENGKITVTRHILKTTDPNASLTLTEYVKACYGFTENAEEMRGIPLSIDGEKIFDFDYCDATYEKEGGKCVSAVLQEITTDFSLQTEGEATAILKKGELFDPYFTFCLRFPVKENQKEIVSWLQIKTTKA